MTERTGLINKIAKEVRMYYGDPNKLPYSEKRLAATEISEMILDYK